MGDTQCTFNIELEKIRGQQQNLNSIIEELEKTLGTTTSSTNNIIGSDENNLTSMLSPNVLNMTHNDMMNSNNDINIDRNDVYSMAETIDQNLTTLNERLQSKINELNQSFKNNKHPLTPVVDILNNHMASLNWIDDKTNEISQKINQIDSNIPK